MGKLGQNFTTWKGNYKEIAFYIEDVDTVVGMTAEWGFSLDVDSASIVEKTSGAGQILLSGKIATVILNPADTPSTLDAGDYYHELRLVSSTGKPTTPAIGTMTLKEVILT